MNKKHLLRNSNFWCLICVTVVYTGDTAEKEKSEKSLPSWNFHTFGGYMEEKLSR